MQVIVDNWTAGLWTAGPAGKNPVQTLTRLTNMQVMDEGTVTTRPGCLRYLHLADTTDGAYMSNEHFFKDSATKVYHNGTDLGFTQSGRRLRIAGLASYGIPLDLTFFPVSMKKYYSGTAYNWGISVVPATPTVSAGAIPGNLSGDYTYRIAFYNSVTGTLGDMSAVTASVYVDGTTIGEIVLTNIPTTCTDSQADEVWIYRTQGGITGSYYYVDKVTLGTATYTDNVSDLGLGDQISYYYISPPTNTIAGRYKSRLLLFGITGNPRYSYPSIGSKPEGYDSHFYEMIADSGDTVEAVVELGDYAFVFGRNSIYQMQVTAGDAIYTSKLATGRGTVNGRTVAVGTNGIYFLSDDGVYVLNGFSPIKMSILIDALFRGVDRGGLSTIADMDMVSGNFVGGRYYLTYYGADDEWHTVIYNEVKKRWKHFTGWRYTVDPITGSMPVVGLENYIGIFDWTKVDDVGTGFTSMCGFNLQGIPPTVLVDFRGYRISVESAGNVQVDLYDNGVLKWSAEPLVAPTYYDAFLKHSVELGEYFVQPEVVISSTSSFTLKAFEASIDPVRKTSYDYTRLMPTSTTQEGAQ
jgi:hypothetical protein